MFLFNIFKIIELFNNKGFSLISIYPNIYSKVGSTLVSIRKFGNYSRCPYLTHFYNSFRKKIMGAIFGFKFYCF